MMKASLVHVEPVKAVQGCFYEKDLVKKYFKCYFELKNSSFIFPVFIISFFSMFEVFQISDKRPVVPAVGMVCIVLLDELTSRL